MKNIVELRNELSSVFSDLKAGEIDHRTAKQMNNAAGKMINTVKVQLDYSKQRGDEPNIEFLNA